MIQKYSIFILFLLMFTSINCEKASHNSKDHILVDLTLTNTSSETDFPFPKMYTTYPVFSTTEISNSNYLNKLKRFKGIPKLDTFLLQTENFKTGNFFAEIALKNTNEKKFSFYKDSLKIFEDGRFNNLNIISGYKGNKQIIIADLNNNRDFSDDQIIKFPHNKNDTIKKTLDNKLAINEFIYKIDDSIYGKFLKRNIRIFPDSNNTYANFLKDSLNKSLATSFELMDFMKGSIRLDTANYDVALQGFIKERVSIIIKPTNVSFSDHNTAYNDNFYYSLGDTLLLENNFYKIDSLNQGLSKIHFKLLPDINYEGKRLGVKLKNYEIQSLNNKSNSIKGLSPNNKFVLLDFWGTWCAPCIKLTPYLKKVHKENDDLSIISIALDESISVVKDYTIRNEMKWNQAFVNKNKRKGIITDLKIKEFPTFILLDSNLKIIYKGSGESALKKIEKIISN